MRTKLNSWLLMFVSGAALAQGADVGLINMVSGEVTFSPPAGAPGKVQAFMRVRDGDRFTVPSGSQMQVVFFHGARQERWLGPASFRAGEKASEPIFGRPAEIANLPASVPQRIARMPELVRNARLAGLQVRGSVSPVQPANPAQQSAVTEAGVTYKQMRSALPADDITPEFFLYAVLHEYQLHEDMKAVVDEMLRRQPENEDAKILSLALRNVLQP